MLQAKLDVVDAAGSVKSRVGALDTRAYQELVPLHLPSKLRDRINKAQRRAAAEKDGVSIFTSNVAGGTLVAETTDSTRASPRSRGNAGDSSSAKAVHENQRRRESQAALAAETPPLPSLTTKEKLHLPDVILGHKMREFEAKMNLNALFVDPLENNLHHLSIDDKEKVMLRMQEKIQGITAQIDAQFVKIKDELDANGIFDSAANAQRAQALCLVELQKRCKLEKLRDDAMREVLDENGGASHAAMSLMEGKLNDLLASKHRTSRDKIDTSAQLAFSHLQKTTKSFALKRRPVAAKRNLSPMKPLQRSPPKPSNQLHHDSHARGAGDNHPEPFAELSVATSAANAVVPAEDWTSRHPHVAHVLQLLAVNGGTLPPPSSSADSLDSFSSRGGCVESTNTDSIPPAPGHRLLTLKDEWCERSTSYQIIASRVCEELLQRWARWRWDSTKHFHTSSDNPLQRSAIVLTDALHRRLRRETPSARLREEEDLWRKAVGQESNDDKRKKVDAVYHLLQDGIQARRQERERRLQGPAKRVSTANSRHGVSSAALPAGPTDLKRAVTADSMSSSASSLKPLETKHVVQRPVEAGGKENGTTLKSLAASASAPVIGVAHDQVDMGRRVRVGELALRQESAMKPEQESPRADSYYGYRDRKLPVLSQQPSRRARVRGESLVGARTSMDLTTLGHFSNARIEERRSSAQTWAWYHPQTRTQAMGSRLLSNDGELHDEEDDEDAESDVDDSERRDAMGGALRDQDGARDDNEYYDSDGGSDDDADSGDDTRSIRSSASSRYVMDSARSSLSVLSKKAGFAGPLGEDMGRARRRRKGSSPKRGNGSRKKRRSPSPSKRPSGTVRGPRGSRLQSRPSNSSNASGSSGGMFAGVHFTANAQVLQHRLEELWRALEFPFSTKLIMLEKYAKLDDADAFSHALTHWESAAEIVLLREKLKHILEEFQELGDLKASSRLAPADWSLLLMQQIEIPPNAINSSAFELVEWTQLHLDIVTQRCEKTAQQLKANTGDELVFQGHRYPPRV